MLLNKLGVGQPTNEPTSKKIKIEGLELLEAHKMDGQTAKVETMKTDSPDDSSDESESTKITVSSATPDDDRNIILQFPNHVITDGVISTIRQEMDLTELGGSLLGVEGATEAPNEQYHAQKKDFTTILQSEMFRLEMGKWLNDEQVNFGFQWYVNLHLKVLHSKYGRHNYGSRSVRFLRSECPTRGNILCLSSHFLSNLIAGKNVQSFTFKEGKKNYNIFRKKIILIPYNHDHHWSCIAIVNPGKVGNYYKEKVAKANIDDEVPM